MRTTWAAGRAWRSTSAGSVTTVSELVGTASLLGGVGDVLERRAGRGHDGRGHRAFDDRRVDEPGVAVGARLEHVADGQDRAADVAEHDDAGALVGLADG